VAIVLAAEPVPGSQHRYPASGVLLMQMGMAVIMLNRRMPVAMRLAFA